QHQERGIRNRGTYTVLHPQGGSLRRPGTRSAARGTQRNLRRRSFLQLPGIGHDGSRVIPKSGVQRGNTRQTRRLACSGGRWWFKEVSCGNRRLCSGQRHRNSGETSRGRCRLPDGRVPYQEP
ncbi:unnamed protein product, partial [Ixodes pacificus]